MSYGRPANFGGSYYNQNNLGYSSVSKNYGVSNRNPGFNQDHNFGEVEFMLQNQRKKFKQAKQKFQYDLDNERKLRIQFQNKLIKLKDQFSRKEVVISQLEFKMNNLLHQNQDVIVQNQRLRNQLARLQDLYGGKIHELENQLTLQTRNYEDMTNQYNTQFEKFKKQGQQYVEQITFQFERKIKNLQDRVKAAQIAKRDLSLQNKKLNDVLISNKLAYEQEIRDIKNRARQQQIKKNQTLSKSFEQRLKVLEQNKEGLVRRNNELIRAIQQKDRKIQQAQNQKNDQSTRLRQQNSDLNQQLQHLNYLVSKLKTQLTQKDSLLGRHYNDNDQELHALRQQLQSKKNENAQLLSVNKDLRLSLKDLDNEAERKRRDLIQRCNFLEGEARKYKEQYQRICQILKSRINQTINTVSYKK